MLTLQQLKVPMPIYHGTDPTASVDQLTAIAIMERGLPMHCNAVPATEADGQPWWHETFGHGWPNYNYYEKRTTNDTADESTFVLRLISLIVKFKDMVFRMVPFLQGTQFPSE